MVESVLINRLLEQKADSDIRCIAQLEEASLEGLAATSDIIAETEQNLRDEHVPAYESKVQNARERKFIFSAITVIGLLLAGVSLSVKNKYGAMLLAPSSYAGMVGAYFAYNCRKEQRTYESTLEILRS